MTPPSGDRKSARHAPHKDLVYEMGILVGINEIASCRK
jgi:hypothetical protein